MLNILEQLHLSKSSHILNYHNLYIEGFALLLAVISLTKPLCFLFLAMYLFWQKKTIRWQLLAILLIILSSRFFIFNGYQNITHIHDQVKIVAIDHYESSHRLTIRYKTHKYHIFVYDDDFGIGDWIDIDGDIKPYLKETIPGGFNANIYYLSHDVLGSIDIEYLSFVKSGYHLFSFRETLMDLVKTEQQSFVKSFVFGKDQLNQAESEPFREANLLFLMQTTGLHAYVFVMLITKLMFYFNMNQQKQQGVQIAIYAILCYLNGFAVGVVRLLFTQVFNMLNKRYKWRLTALDRLFIVCFVMIIICFQWVYSIGFLMTFLILLTLTLSRERYMSYRGYLKRLVMGILIVLVCLPFTKELQPIVLICLPILIIYVTFFLYPLSFVLCFTSKFDQLFSCVLKGFMWSVDILNQQQLCLYLPSLSYGQILVYYGLFAYVLYAYTNKQLLIRMIILSSLFGFRIVENRYINDASVYFIDVGQGDTAYIETRYCQVMIDSFDGATDFLKNHGVYQLDMLFLTHSDEDHTKEAHDIIQDIGVDTLIINPFDDAYDDYQTKTTKAYAHQTLMCGDLSFDILGPLKHYGNANDNSLVMAVTICNERFLFTGDINERAELDLIDTYGRLLKSDVLKVAHHGSNTSSSTAFITYVSPDEAIISAGRYNRFDFPHQETINTLLSNHVRIYRTDQCGTITIKYKKTEKLWETTLSFSDDF